MSDLRVVFMGTPEFAVTILDKLVQEKMDVVGVVTAPDKPAGRGRKINQSAVKQYAVEHELNILQPTNLKDAAFVDELQSLNADVFVVVAFRMLPEVVWAMPPKGTINLHASLLPNYRGAAPINWAIINGESESGVTTFCIEKEIDTGKIIEQSKVSIGSDETVGELYGRLMHLGADVMHHTLMNLDEGMANAKTQDDLMQPNFKPAPKIFKQDCEIDFSQSVQTVHNFCRGLSPYPAAWCKLTDTSKEETKTFKIFGTKISDKTVSDTDSILSDSEGLLFPCSDFYIRVTEIQPEGKRRMQFKEFLAGNSVENLIISWV
ncbi:MAG: methionyl-tRNA formyltransferase [Fluviicola sp. XM-24bin1]|nr:MAG: methionyl-tRNA formyltransferase [Fluviicola sp. XM-24bin1]